MKLPCLLVLVVGATIGSSSVIVQTSDNEIVENSNGAPFSFPSADDLQDLVRQKCIQNGGGEEGFGRIMNARPIVERCIQEFVLGMSTARANAMATKRHDFGFVIQSVCDQLIRSSYPSFKLCMQEFYEAADGCLSQADRDGKDQSFRMIEKGLDYACSNGGEPIISFITGGGPQCLKERRTGVLDCARDTMEKYTNVATSSSISAEDCRDMSTLRSCVARELQECEFKAPGTAVNGLLNAMLEATPCRVNSTNI